LKDLCDIFALLPNHIHGIIQIVGASLAGAQGDNAGLWVTRMTTMGSETALKQRLGKKHTPPPMNKKSLKAVEENSHP